MYTYKPSFLDVQTIGLTSKPNRSKCTTFASTCDEMFRPAGQEEKRRAV